MTIPNLAALQRHDESAWMDAWNWLAPKARVVARAKLQGPLSHEIEDVVAETLEAITKRISIAHDVDELSRLTPCIAYRRANDHLRKYYRNQNAFVDESSPTSVESDDDCLADLLQELLMQVNPAHREVLVQLYLQDKTPEAIADELGYAVDTVYVYKKRGIDAIRAVLDRHPNILKDSPDAKRLSYVTLLFLSYLL